jgi:hypothetical protein
MSEIDRLLHLPGVNRKKWHPLMDPIVSQLSMMSFPAREASPVGMKVGQSRRNLP